MRVVGGRWRGRRLPAAVPSGVRPTSDRVRESVFNILASLDVVSGASVADLFCGSGALGLEALSRGARSAVFVDRSAISLAAVRANAEHLGAEPDRLSVVQGTLPRWLEGGPPAAFHPGHWDLAFCDPPYAFSGWERLLEVLPAEVAVLESSEEPMPPDGWGAWDVVRSRRYGGTLVTVASRRPREVQCPFDSSLPAGPR